MVRRAKDKGHRLEPQHNRVARAAFQYREARASGGLPRIETKKFCSFLGFLKNQIIVGW
jgi:hypothetical protein